MPQIFQVLRCFKCVVFQVHQTKKSNKWECKLCGEKQSVKRHYGIGTAKDCRLHVQSLNGMRGEIDELNSKHHTDNSEDDNEDTDIQKPIIAKAPQPNKNSKWSNYIEKTETIEDANEIQHLGDAEVVLEMPKKRRKPFNSNFKRKSNIAKCSDEEYQADNQEYGKKNNNSLKDTWSPVVNSIEVQLKTQNVELGNIKEEKFLPNSMKSSNENSRTFIPPALNKNSKWAQFTEIDEDHRTDLPSSSAIESSQNNFSFSLCDDTNLDSVLDI